MLKENEQESQDLLEDELDEVWYDVQNEIELDLISEI
jgi:hypothetical protein